ncbi:MAG: class I SAM-dependent methyltransferase [Gemmatimonadales bacterium]
MSLFYEIAYRIGFTPWEVGLAQPAVAAQISRMFDREEAGRQPPFGKALDLGCGSGIHSVNLSRRGWEVTGVDNVPKALHRARERARDAGVEMKFLEGDLTRLRDSGVGSGFRLLVDFGAIHGLYPEDRRAAGREVDAVAAEDATVLILAFAPGNRGPLPRGMGRPDIEETFPGWQITDGGGPQDARLPWLLKLTGADPQWYRLRRKDQ